MRKLSSHQKIENRRKIFGTTIYIGNIDINTKFGLFDAHCFQNLITKNFILALVVGDLKAPILYTRMHSSCVTSETMRSLDCDCVQQLNGAIKLIAEKKNGIFFYLIQEGRGCGYVSKSIDRMINQHEPSITTFDAYELMGLKPDYRTYDNISDICKILEIPDETQWVLFTNNPDKIKKFTEIGLKIHSILQIEFKPNIFNQEYLDSKKESGHLLIYNKEKNTKYTLPHIPIEPFEPYSLPTATRFVHVSSYYLPIKPVKNQFILEENELQTLIKEMDSETLKWIKYQKIGEQKFFLKVLNKDVLDKYPSLHYKPYWFKVNVFYDIASGTEFVVLEYGDVRFSKNRPIVRIHSESLMNRFPLSFKKYKGRYKRVLESIVKNGCGLIVLLYHDGRGAGLGCYFLEKKSNDPDIVGIKLENRDFEAAFHLVKDFVGTREIIIMSGSSSLPILKISANLYGLNVFQWKEIITLNKDLGHQSLKDRIDNTDIYIQNNMLNGTNLNEITFDAPEYYVTGVGSSEAHARHLASLINKYTKKKATFIQLVSFYRETKIDVTIPCILFSQGLSPNVKRCLDLYACKNLIIITSVNENHQKKDRVETYLNIISKGSQILRYNEEIPDDTLIRVLGPVGVFGLNLKIIDKIIGGSIANYDIGVNLINEMVSNKNYKSEIYGTVEKFCRTDKICIITSYPLVNFMSNILSKFIEGVFYPNPYVSDFISFSHGIYQCIQNTYIEKDQKYCLLLIIDDSSEKFVERMYTMYDKEYICEYRLKLKDEMQILELETYFNLIIFNMIYKLNIDQKNWKGKEKEDALYKFF